MYLEFGIEIFFASLPIAYVYMIFVFSINLWNDLTFGTVIKAHIVITREINGTAFSLHSE